jgi:hypothetical protein
LIIGADKRVIILSVQMRGRQGKVYWRGRQKSNDIHEFPANAADVAATPRLALKYLGVRLYTQRS